MDELEDLSARVGSALKARGLWLVTAESCTGGWLGQAITAVPGSSQWYERGFITYTNRAKEEMLGVSPDTLARHGAVSEAVVAEMAQGALAKSPADVSVAISGIAGPGGATPGKPVGTVCMAWATREGELRLRTFHFEGDRAAVRRQAVAAALEGLLALTATPAAT
ncbi:MAG: nicotinamide-nucleotide amidohydrolase family protein [Burkholderiales bacterium]|nr:nicotinamide-nucleotide amidohydrolase family protein [Burkholderiales bacterium]